MNAGAARIRILVTAASAEDPEWLEWLAARDSSPFAARMMLQRVSRDRHKLAALPAAALGYGERLRWFAPVESTEVRRRLVAYAAEVLQAGEFVQLGPELARFSLAPSRAAAPAALDASSASNALDAPHVPNNPNNPNNPSDSDESAASLTLDGIVLLSHAETDLLALARVRKDLPAGFPSVVGHSLNGLVNAEALLALFGTRRSPNLTAIVRVHGAASSVPGLTELIARAHEEGWAIAVISGVGGSAELQPRTRNVTSELAANLTAYVMAGGVANVLQALRYVAHERLGFTAPFAPPQPMPAHGLYHPDLLVTYAAEWETHRAVGNPVALVLFYRAHVLSGNLQFVDQTLRALESRGFAAIGAFTSSLRDRDVSGLPMALRLLSSPLDVVVNTVSYPVFALSSLEPPPSDTQSASFESLGVPLVQAICCGTTRAVWAASSRGLSPTEAAMNIALPECDGRVITVPVSFKENHQYVPDAERVARVANIARRFAVLRRKPNADKRVAVVLTNAGGKAQRIGGAVGLDTPASLLKWLHDMRAQGYSVGALPDSADTLMQALLACGCYDEKCPIDAATASRMPRARYTQWFRGQSAAFQRSVRESWGEPAIEGPTLAPPFWRENKQSARRSPLLSLHEPHTDDCDYLFSGIAFGNVFVTLQPPRGFGVDPDVVYHAPDLPPCHHYSAFYRWLAEVWQADAMIHFGTHGTLEWLPGKSLALSADCAPDALLGDMPLFYPFVVNNPGEGAQAKRRAHAVIVDHLVPPLTQAETYGPLATLSRLVEEYYRAEVLDPGKLPVLRAQIWELVRAAQLEDDLKEIRRERHGDHEHPWDERINEQGIPRALERMSGRAFAHLLEDLDAYLCDLGRAQIRGGLHVFGVPPQGDTLVALVFAVLRVPNGAVPSLIDSVCRACLIDPERLRKSKGVWPDATAAALAVGARDAAAPAAGAHGAAIGSVTAVAAHGVVTVGHVHAAIDALASALLQKLAARGFAREHVDGVLAETFGPPNNTTTVDLRDLITVLHFTCDVLVPNLLRTTDETRHLLAALDGRYVPAGPSGSPSRGMAHVLPTGRNFYTVDPRGLPTPAAWATGTALAVAALNRHLAETGKWPESIALSVWGTPTMRTGGDDIAQAMALIGVRPQWDPETRRTVGLEVMSLAELGHPRIDVTLRVSGFFRDAFPALMLLFDEAVQRVIVLDEPVDLNYVRKHWLAESAALSEQGHDSESAARRASYRVFSSKPGAYGTGVMDLIENRAWRERSDLADAVLLWDGWAYTPERSDGVEATEAFRRQLAGIDLALHNQDNLEQDLFDSSDYFEFHGGLFAAIASVSQRMPRAYFGDSSTPSRPEVRTLQGEALRVYRSRVVNPKWLNGMQRHGYRGGLEMAMTVDCLFGFSATAGIVTHWMFEGIAESFASGQAAEFLRSANPWALTAIVERLLEAEQRKLWAPEPATLERLRSSLLDSEATLEEIEETRVPDDSHGAFYQVSGDRRA